MPKQPVRVQIFHQNYSLLADDDPREVQALAQQVDELMVSIAERAASSDSTRVAVLACFHLADKLKAAEKRLKSYEAESARMSELLNETLDKG
ncbi:MAG TPA: cell division protein ZapA [Bryobacteraceae bacterium]|jgi:cell division protein ZapA|nr:cell division protein ZapA [Bryobacteraceae bacterium]